MQQQQRQQQPGASAGCIQVMPGRCSASHSTTLQAGQGQPKHTEQGLALLQPPTCSVKNTNMVPVEALHMYQNSISWKKPDTRKVASRARACRASLGLRRALLAAAAVVAVVLVVVVGAGACGVGGRLGAGQWQVADDQGWS